MRYELELAQVSDTDLLRRLHSLLQDSRHTESELVAHIGEVDARRLFAREASPSMHVYCMEVLHLSEAEAYLRITAGRLGREYPAILEMLGDGRLHLSAISRLAPHLTPDNHADLLARATHKSRRQVEELVAELAPRPDVPAVVRKLPTKAMSEASPSTPEPHGATTTSFDSAPQLCPDRVGSTVTSSPVARVEVLAPARYKVQFTASAAFRGRRCPERHGLEYHHVVPFGLGGVRTLANVCLMCRAHDQYLADCDYGKAKMDRYRPAPRGAPARTCVP